jgi:uncharacterized protein YndB with AHSA1/START domain
MKLDPVIVTWADAHSDSSGWTGVKEHIDEGEYIVQSVGWLLTESDGGKPGHVTICQSYTPDEDVDHILHIPQAMVRQMHTIHTDSLQYPHGH